MLIPDALEGPLEGLAAAGEGAGELFKAVGEIAKHLGKGTGWIVEQGPYAMFAAYLALEGKTGDLWGQVFEEDFPDSLTEYHQAGLVLPDPFDPTYVDAATGKFKMKEYMKQWKYIWHQRYGLLDRSIFRIKALELAHAEPELFDLKRLMEELEGKNVDALAYDRPKLERRLEEIDELLGTDLSEERERALLREQTSIHAKLDGQNASMDLSNQRWYVYENGMRKVVGNPPQYAFQIVDLNQKRSELERRVEASKKKIAFYEDQQKKILERVDPQNVMEKAQAKRDKKFREIMRKAHLDALLSQP